MAAASLSTFSSLSLRHSSGRFSLLSPLPTTTSFSSTTSSSSLFFPLSLSTTKFNCTPDEIVPETGLNESEISEVEEDEKELEDNILAEYREPRLDIDPLTSTEDEIAAAYEKLYGPAYSGVTLLNNDVYEMDKKGKSAGASESRERVRDGFDEQVVQLRRVTKVVKGGKKMNFRAIVVVGNKKGKVGVGHGKASEIASAVQKAAYDARRNIIDVPLTRNMTFPHRANGKYGAAEVMLRPACPGTGVIAGGAVRAVLELAGLQNALGKQLRSNNPLNNARATIYAILKMSSFSEVAAYRGIPMEEMWK